MSALLLLPLLLAQTHGRWEASVRTEVRARSSVAQDQVAIANPDAGTSAADLELRPSLGGSVFNGPWTLSAGYSGTLFVREPYLKPRVDSSHIVQVNAVWAREGSPRVFLDEYVNFGVLDVTNVGTTATGPMMGPVQPPGSVPLTQQLTTDTALGVDWPLARSLTLTTRVGYAYGGGLNKASQLGAGGAILPLQSSPRAGARLAWTASRYDSLTVSLLGSLTSFKAADECFDPALNSCPYAGAQIWMAELSANYTRLLAEHTSVDLTAGATAAVGLFPDGSTQPGILPMGGAGLSHRVQFKSHRFDLRLSGLAGPYVDRFRGTVYERVEGNGSVGWGNNRGLFAYARAGVSQSLTGGPTTAAEVQVCRAVQQANGTRCDYELFVGYGELGAGYQGARWWRVDLSGREALTRTGPTVAPGPGGALIAQSLQSQWIVGLSATFTAQSAPQNASTE